MAVAKRQIRPQSQVDVKCVPCRFYDAQIRINRQSKLRKNSTQGRDKSPPENSKMTNTSIARSHRFNQNFNLRSASSDSFRSQLGGRGGGGGKSSQPAPQDPKIGAISTADEPAESRLRISRQPSEVDDSSADVPNDDAPLPAETRDDALHATKEGPQPAADRLASNSLIGSGKLRIVRLLAPEAVQNGTTNVTIDCMFKFDQKLDERLTIKWFFNDEVEPIYQWIPELNKRVYSDKFERFIDKSFQVTEDVDFMLQAYKWLQQQQEEVSSVAIPAEGAGQPDHLAAAAANNEQQSGTSQLDDLTAARRLLAARLSKLANLGGRGHSRQLIESLRAALAMDLADFARFRALRLIGPTTELSGRYTCSVSSLDGEDMRSTHLVVYEPARSLNFTVTRAPNSQQYRLLCHASHAFPRPTLSLFRYRAGPAAIEPRGPSLQPNNQRNTYSAAYEINRPRLAATQLRREPIPGTQTQITVSSRGSSGLLGEGQPGAQPIWSSSTETSGLDSDVANDISVLDVNGEGIVHQPAAYEISAWVLVDESSLSSHLVTQFECQLTIEGTSYEQRQTLALQRGWHVNPAALTATHYTLAVGLFVALASLLCFLIAIVKYLMIQRKIRSRSAVGDLTQPVGARLATNLSGSSFCGVK